MQKKWGLLLTVGLVLGVAAATLSFWLPALAAFASGQSSAIQGLQGIIQIILWLAAAVFALFSWLQRPKSEIPTSSAEQGSIALVGDASDAVLNTGDGNRIVRTETYIEKQMAGKQTETDPATLRRTYLSRLFTNCRSLSLAGIDPKAASSEAEARLNLDAVYTAMLTLQSETPEAEQRHATPGKEARRISAVEQLNRHKNLALLSDPGGGKSTFVNFVALCLAGEAMGNEEAGLQLLTAPLPQDDEDDEKENQTPQPWVHGPLLPVRVILRDFAARGLPAAGETACADHLWRFIERELQDAGIGDFAPHLRRELLERGGLLLLDGLDEVPGAEKQREQLKQVVEDFVATFKNCRVLVTSRIYAYQDKAWRLAGFSETTLAPFSKGQIRRFIRCWYDHTALLRGMAVDDARGKATLLEQAVFDSQALLGFAERPLLLTLIASLHAWQGGGALPEKRVDLYADAVDLLLDWWESPKVVRDAAGNVQVQPKSLTQWLQVDREQMRRLLNELAFKAHAGQKQLTGAADISEDELVGGLMRLRRNQDVNPALLVDYLSQRAGLLLPRGIGVYTFPHRTFQEYLAACHLTDDNFPDKLAKLGREDPDRWREVVLLAAGKSGGGSDFAVWALAESLCPLELGKSEKTNADAWGALLAGQILAESARLAPVSPGNKGKLVRVQAWLVSLLSRGDFPAVERAAAGNALARLGDPRFRPDAWHLPDDDLLGFVEIPAGPFLMGSDKKRDSEAYDDELPQHELDLPAFYISRYPVTVAQFRAFVEAADYKPEDPNCLRGTDNHPVRYVTWHEALKYCEWITQQLRESDKTPPALKRLLREENWIITLPSGAEWEKAARGADGRIYPWGDKPDPNKANYGDTRIGATSAVGCFSGGERPFDCEDMSGNVWEWTRSLWGKDWQKPDYGYPYNAADGRENQEASNEILRVVRGGAFLRNGWFARCASRVGGYPDYGDGYLGFRVVARPFFVNSEASDL